MSRKSSRRARQQDKAPQKSAELQQALHGLSVQDAFQNLLARTGVGMPNLMEGTRYFVQRLTQNYNLMTALYRNNWIARAIVDIIPQDMMKNWIRFSCELTPEELDAFQRTERKTKIQRQILTGLKWGRLYGGGAGLMMIEGQEDILDTPLDLDSIMPGDFKGLLVTDRWNGARPSLELVEDISSPEFGLPEYYEFVNSQKESVGKVHHSRIVRFNGCDLPDVELQAESYWGSSVLEVVFEELKKRDNTSANIAALVFQAQLKVLKMDDFGEKLGSAQALSQQKLRETINALNWLLSSQGMLMLSQNDSFESVNYTFSGINDIYESFMLDMAGAAKIPATRLFGRSPAGMNATGESDMRNYYDVVVNDQNCNLEPVLDKLLPVMAMSTWGRIPDDFDYRFNPIHKPTDKEIGENIKWKFEAVQGAFDSGLISERIALQELRQFGDESGLFNNITDEDIARASDVVVKPELEMAGLDDEENPEGKPEPEGTD